jgi:hypothetical protein
MDLRKEFEKQNEDGIDHVFQQYAGARFEPSGGASWEYVEWLENKINTSDNSDYTKLPSFDDIKKDLIDNGVAIKDEDISCVMAAVVKLGNFA